jgi:methylmalonyl-CoA mutase cobalamin-binding subunit
MGHRPGKVVPLPLDELRSRLDEGVKTTRASAFRVDKAFSPDEADRWTQWLAQDRSDLIRQALQQQILRQGLGMVVDELIAPLCVLVGQAWMNGDISIYQEHLFTETLQSVLREAISLVDASGQTLQRSPRVLLTTTPNEQHGLGLLMAECHFALETCERFVLGTSTPIADIILAVQQLNIHVLALSFSAHASRRDVLESLQMLVEQIPSRVQIWVGGTGALHHKRLLPAQVMLMQKPVDVAYQVRSWRQKNGLLENPADNASHLA